VSIQFRGVARLAGVDESSLILPPLVWGALLAIGLFASVTVHELAHTLVAIRLGGSVRSITLMLLGGVSQLAHAPKRPRDEALVAIVGPITSLVLGAILIALRVVWTSAPPDVLMALFYLGAMNVTLGLFNLLPAFPMDGGRVLRAVLAAILDRERATVIAGSIGKVCAFGLGVLGLLTGNLLMIVIAVFVYVGARAEIDHERVQRALDGLRIVDLVPTFRQPLPVVRANATIADALERMREVNRLELVVVDERDQPIGAIHAGELRALSASARASTTVGELVAALPSRQIVVPWDTSANDALEAAAEANAELVLVVDPRTGLVGVVAADDIARTVRMLTRPTMRSGGRPRTA